MSTREKEYYNVLLVYITMKIIVIKSKWMTIVAAAVVYIVFVATVF